MTPVGYCDIHKLFLQAMMSRSIVTKKMAVTHLKHIYQILGYPRKEITETTVTNTIEEINSKISSLSMQIKEVLSEYDAEKFLVLVNTGDDSAILEKIDHIYSVKEREVFRVFLESIVLSTTYGSISTMDALNLEVPNVGTIKPGEIQDIKEKFLSDKWFIETTTGYLIPGPRTIAEFEMYFKKNFHDNVQECPLCSNVVFQGMMCPHCDTITHKHCFQTFNKRRGGNEQLCPQPSCKQPFVTENGTSSQEERNSQLRQNTSQRTRKSAQLETPQNTPSVSGHASSESSLVGDITPGPSRGSRKRRSVE